MIASIVLWLGLLAAVPGAVSLARPLRFAGIRTRRRGAAVLAAGLAAAAGAALWPARRHMAGGSLAIDRALPEYHFNERHAIEVRATPDAVDRAIREVTGDDVRSLVALMKIRSFPARLLGAPRRRRAGRSILNVATASSFFYLSDEPGREIVLGTVGRFWTPSGGAVRVRIPQEFMRLGRRDAARAAMNFAIVPLGPVRCRVTTETRIEALSPAALRKFTAYWRLIYPGSSLIRADWLRAIRRRAEAAAPPHTP